MEGGLVVCAFVCMCVRACTHAWHAHVSRPPCVPQQVWERRVKLEKRHSPNYLHQVSKSSCINHRPQLIFALTSLSLAHAQGDTHTRTQTWKVAIWHISTRNTASFWSSESKWPLCFQGCFGRKIVWNGQMASRRKNAIPRCFCHVFSYYVFVIYEICVLKMIMICEVR